MGFPSDEIGAISKGVVPACNTQSPCEINGCTFDIRFLHSLHITIYPTHRCSLCCGGSRLQTILCPVCNTLSIQPGVKYCERWQRTHLVLVPCWTTNHIHSAPNSTPMIAERVQLAKPRPSGVPLNREKGPVAYFLAYLDMTENTIVVLLSTQPASNLANRLASGRQDANAI